MFNKDKSYTVGNARVTRLVETSLKLPPEKLFSNWNDSAHDDCCKWLVAGEQRNPASVTLSVHTWIVEHEGKTILIDTGVGNSKDRPFSPAFHHLTRHFCRILRRSAFIQGRSIWSFLPTYTQITSAGTPITTALVGCRRSQMQHMFFRRLSCSSFQRPPQRVAG